MQEKVKLKSSTHKQPAFSITKGLGREFADWLRSVWGRGKTAKDSNSVARRSMKYLSSTLGDCDNDSVATEDYVDSVLGSPNLLMKFLKIVIEEWELKAAAILAYLQSITDLVDFRKSKGCSDSVLRTFAVTEVYLRKCKSTMYRRKNIEYTRDLSLEKLIARNSWATLEDMDEVIPYHSPKFMEVVGLCKDPQKSPSPADLIFATRFICTFLFLRVKATRPMTIQFLTTSMIAEAHDNGGFVDSTKFKTSKDYIFDSLKFSEPALVIIDKYIEHIRPHCKPAEDCTILLVNTKGTMFTALGSAMTLLVHQAIGKHINPTRYRQIIETASSDNLSKENQETVTADQKHHSVVAKRFVKQFLYGPFKKITMFLIEIFNTLFLLSNFIISQKLSFLKNVPIFVLCISIITFKNLGPTRRKAPGR